MELELKQLRESQLIKKPILPFLDMYDASPKNKEEERRRDTWQNLTNQGMGDDSIAEGRNPQDNPALLTPGRNGPDPTPKPRDDEPYVSVLRQDGSEVQGAVAINLS